VVFNPGADIDISALESTRPEDIVSQMQCTIVNLRGLSSEQQYSIVFKVLKKLLDAIMVMQIPPFYLALDEAHLFAGRSKKGDPYVKDTLEIVRRFSQEGRKFGANMIVLTQRPQLLDMTVRSLSATWIIHRLTDPNDTRIAVESGG
jgi:DNA helicase HerA-like ATPase